MGWEAARRTENSYANVESSLGSQEGRASVLAEFGRRVKSDKSLTDIRNQLRNLMITLAQMENLGTDSAPVRDRIVSLLHGVKTEAPSPVTEEKKLEVLEDEGHPEHANDNIPPINGRVRRGLFAVNDNVPEENQPVMAVSETSAPEESPVSPESSALPESVEVPIDVDALRMEVEGINDEVGECNALSLLKCVEYRETYSILHRAIQHAYFDVELSPEQAQKFKEAVEGLRKAKDEVIAKIGPSRPSIISNSPVLETSAAASTEVPSEEGVIEEAATTIPEIVGEIPQEVFVSESAPDVESRLKSKEVTDGLETMLEEWFGGSGFLGLGASGINHPDFQALKGCLVESIKQNDVPLEARKKVKQNMLTSVIENIERWSSRNGIHCNKGETFEHYMRRVVLANIENAQRNRDDIA